MKKYYCIGSGTVEAEWLPRWYGVPYDECMFAHVNKDKKYNLPHTDTLIILKVRLDKNYDIKIAKTEYLLNGGT